MRKFLLTIICLTMLVSISVMPMAQGSVKLKFWNYYDGVNAQVMEQLIQKFNETHSGIQVQSVFVPGSELLSKLQTAIASEEVPALAISDIIGMPLLVRTGALLPLDDYIEESGINLDDFYESLLVYGRYKGKLYSLPISTNNLQLFWNKELFRAAGLDPESPPESWGELVNYSKQIRETTGKWGYELFTTGGEGTTWQWQVFLWQAGGEFLTPPDYDSPAFNSPAGVKALRFWVDLIHKYKVSTLAPWGLFGKGEAAMVMDGSWMVQFFPEQVDFELGTAPMPIPAGGEHATNMGGEQIFIFKTTDKKEEAAWTFVKWLTSTSAQIEWDKGTGFTPVRDSVAENESYVAYVKNTQPLLLPFIEQQKNAHARPPVPQYSKISDIVSRYIQEALYQRMTPEEALNSAAEEVQQELQK